MGKIEAWITEDEIFAEKILHHLDNPGYGAHSLFLGVVRNHHLGKAVRAVSYDIYKILAEKVLQEICKEAQLKWGPELDCIVVHRVGKLKVKEVSVAIATGSPHRAECYLASQYIIDELKMRAPIWKQEHYEEGESEWLPGHVLCVKRVFLA